MKDGNTKGGDVLHTADGSVVIAKDALLLLVEIISATHSKTTQIHFNGALQATETDRVGIDHGAGENGGFVIESVQQLALVCVIQGHSLCNQWKARGATPSQEEHASRLEALEN